MFRDLVTPIQTGLFRRLSTLLGFAGMNKQTLSHCTDRMSALNDPATRNALAELPEHLLRDIGVVSQRHDSPDAETTAPPAGNALRRYLW